MPNIDLVLAKLDELTRAAETGATMARTIATLDDRLTELEEQNEERDHGEQIAAARAEGEAAAMARLATPGSATDAAEAAADFVAMRRQGVRALKWALPFLLTTGGVGGGAILWGSDDGSSSKTEQHDHADHDGTMGTGAPISRASERDPKRDATIPRARRKTPTRAR